LINESICCEKSSEKSISNEPEVLGEVAPAGTAKCSEPPPDAKTVVSTVGVVRPPVISGNPGAAFPLTDAAVSNDTQRITPAAAQRAWKSALAFESPPEPDALDTVTVTAVAVVLFPEVSVAVAESVCEPLLAVVVSHETL
jgi:hypothetical protein